MSNKKHHTFRKMTLLAAKIEDSHEWVLFGL